ncbi:MFS transporter [Aeromicrobium sp. 179-A 4D2 NHS]|uniref:MFS transporter n=1 Tax=Aeromicrobium sp. 179-A 4D2 NHS TaxID=3142375 RepID=UPI0039A2A5F9
MAHEHEPSTRTWSPWRGVLAFGFVSLLADMVYEGMRSIAGPYLGQLGASAAAVGLITGAGEAAALVLRLVAGRMADRTQRHWLLTGIGYGLTAACVPLLAVAPELGAAGLGVATVLILTERTGKALRSPSKSVLLASAARGVGRGKGFGVHKALDQVGAFAGPLVVAGIAAVWSVQAGLAALAVPGLLAMLLLAVLRRRLATPDLDERAVPGAASPGPLPRRFHAFATATAVTTAGLLTFGLFGYHLAEQELVPTALVPVVYAGAMAAAAVSALVAGVAFDRWGGGTLMALPLLVAPVPALVFLDGLAPALLGIALWGAATGVQDSTVKALVADLVPHARLATAYGVFAAYQGVAALAGGAIAGLLYAEHRGLLAVGTAVAMVLAYVPLRWALRHRTATDA